MEKLAWIALVSLWRKEIMRFMRAWIQTLLTPVITMTLYFIVFGQLVGTYVGDTHGYNYMQFITPGLIIMSVMTNAYNNVCTSFFVVKFQRYIETLWVAPLSTHIIILGYVGGGVVRGLLTGLFVMLVSFLFADYTLHSWLLVIIVLLLTAVVFSLAGFINAILVKSVEDLNTVFMFVLVPLTYLSGVFYSLSQLPVGWQIISQLNPIIYITSSFRYGFLGISEVPLLATFWLLGLLLSLLYTVAWFLIEIKPGLKN